MCGYRSPYLGRLQRWYVYFLSPLLWTPRREKEINRYIQENRVNWILNIAAGTWAPGPSETTPEAESSTNTLANGAKALDCSGCSGTKDIGYIGGSPGGTLTFTNVTSSVATTSTIRVAYINGDKSQRYANVLVNGVGKVLAFVPTEVSVSWSKCRES